MLTLPPSELVGRDQPYWALAQLDCPQGRLVCAVCPDPVPEVVLAGLHPHELAYSKALSGDRRREWIAGRYCLASALGDSVSARVPILTSPDGAPVVRAGAAGSISHKGPLTVALASEKRRGVGVDVDYIEESDWRFGQKVLTSHELQLLGEIESEAKAAIFVMVHFAIKEAIYKCVDSSLQSNLDFGDIQLDVDPKRLSIEGQWLASAVRVRAMDDSMMASVRIDGRWVLAASSRE